MEKEEEKENGAHRLKVIFAIRCVEIEKVKSPSTLHSKTKNSIFCWKKYGVLFHGQEFFRLFGFWGAG